MHKNQFTFIERFRDFVRAYATWVLRHTIHRGNKYVTVEELQRWLKSNKVFVYDAKWKKQLLLQPTTTESGEPHPKPVTTEDHADKISTKPFLVFVDGRRDDEFDYSHIPSAIHGHTIQQALPQLEVARHKAGDPKKEDITM
eukprot:GEZU01042564.1.p1 GENE.GEZU01042564.1~~GEZU01042564.1.p1  ORF type:complete len:142 (+),score=17.95 GEZU01042564.1:297-722(+)